MLGDAEHAEVLARVDLDLEPHPLHRFEGTVVAVAQCHPTAAALVTRCPKPGVEPFTNGIRQRTDRTSSKLDQIDVLRVAAWQRDEELVQRGPSAKSEPVGDDRVGEQLDQRTGNNEILLDLFVLRPWSVGAPRSDVRPRNHRSGSTITLGATRK